MKITSDIDPKQCPNPKWEGGICELDCGQLLGTDWKSELVQSKVVIEQICIVQSMSVSTWLQ